MRWWMFLEFLGNFDSNKKSDKLNQNWFSVLPTSASSKSSPSSASTGTGASATSATKPWASGSAEGSFARATAPRPTLAKPRERSARVRLEAHWLTGNGRNMIGKIWIYNRDERIVLKLRPRNTWHMDQKSWKFLGSRFDQREKY